MTPAFRQRLSNWPKISQWDETKLSDFLRECETAMTTNWSLQILNDYRENRAILKKLPTGTHWPMVSPSARLQRLNENVPPFFTLLDFIARKTRIACDPITSVKALKEDKTCKPTSRKSRVTALSTEAKENFYEEQRS